MGGEDEKDNNWPFGDGRCCSGGGCPATGFGASIMAD